MKKKRSKFWTFFIIWSIINVTLLILAVYDVFGKFDKSAKEFWPFTVGGLKTYDFFELGVYLGIPLIVYYLTRFVQQHHRH